MASKTGADMGAMIVDAYRNGEGGVTLARRLGVGTTTVYRVLRRHGIRRRASSARPKRFSVAEERLIAARYAKEGSSARVAHEYGCSAVLVRTIARRHGVDVGARGGRVKHWSDDERADIVRQYRAGASQCDIADAAGISQTTVSRILREEGVTAGNRRERHGNWKGGRSRMGDYTAVLVEPDDPYASMRTSLGYVLEHRLVMAKSLGRPLTKRETVHHINGDKRDNRLENLQLRQGRHGNGESMMCGDCGSRNLVHVPLKGGTRA